jgi:hypothetical protein
MVDIVQLAAAEGLVAAGGSGVVGGWGAVRPPPHPPAQKVRRLSFYI